MKYAVLLTFLVACGFSPMTANVTGEDVVVDAAVDALPAVTCGDLTCDPHATCGSSGSAATCACAAGFSGDGMSCSDIDECGTTNGGCAGACQNTTGSFTCYVPATCADLVAHGVSGASERTLYLDGNVAKPWQAYCTAGNVEYITVVNVNQSMYAAGGASSGSDVKTTFTRLRFVVAQKKLDITDRTFATDNGNTLTHSNSGIVVKSLPLGIAMDCKSNGSATATATVDLIGTHFALTGSAAFASAGSNNTNSTTTMASNNQKATLKGGGFCGWNAPVGAPTNPFNNNVTNGLLLDLVYF